jgi:hypothetical protein
VLDVVDEPLRLRLLVQVLGRPVPRVQVACEHAALGGDALRLHLVDQLGSDQVTEHDEAPAAVEGLGRVRPVGGREHAEVGECGQVEVGHDDSSG